MLCCAVLCCAVLCCAVLSIVVVHVMQGLELGVHKRFGGIITILAIPGFVHIVSGAGSHMHGFGRTDRNSLFKVRSGPNCHSPSRNNPLMTYSSSITLFLSQSPSRTRNHSLVASITPHTLNRSPHSVSCVPSHLCGCVPPSHA